MYTHTKNKVSSSHLSKLEHKLTDRITDAEKHYHAAFTAVIRIALIRG